MRFDIRPAAIPTVAVTIAAGISQNQLSWGGFGFRVEVYASTENTLQNNGVLSATYLGSTTDNTFSHTTSGTANWYYWVRAVDAKGRFGEWCPSSTTGWEVTSRLSLELNALGTALQIKDKMISGINPSDGSIRADTVSTNWVYAGNISAGQINTGSIAANIAYLGTVSADNISTGTITGCKYDFTYTDASGTVVSSFGKDKYAYLPNDSPSTVLMTDGGLAISSNTTKSTYAIFAENLRNNGGVQYLLSRGGYTLECRNLGGTLTTNQAIRGICNHATGTGIYGSGHYGGYFDGDGTAGSYALYVGAHAKIVGNLTVNGSVTATSVSGLTKSSVGLGNVDNTADSSKSVSYAGSANTAHRLDHTDDIILNNGNYNTRLQASDGNLVTYTGTGTSGSIWSAHYGWTSDKKYKERIADTSAIGLSVINSLRVRDFFWKEDFSLSDGRVHTGFIAQELQEVVPEAVGDVGGTLMINKADLVPYLVKAVQELSTKIAELEAKMVSV